MDIINGFLLNNRNYGGEKGKRRSAAVVLRARACARDRTESPQRGTSEDLK
jgi:hypothetical protein